jgi:hypothetical protein
MRTTHYHEVPLGYSPSSSFMVQYSWRFRLKRVAIQGSFNVHFHKYGIYQPPFWITSNVNFNEIENEISEINISLHIVICYVHITV